MPHALSMIRLVSRLLGIALATQLCAGDWPQYRGAARDGHAAFSGAPLDQLPQDLKPVWKLKIGGGFASPVVSRGKVIYLDERNGSEVAHALDAATGKELWSQPYAVAFEDEWGVGPRCTPVVDGELIFVQSCKGEFSCLSFADGKRRWGVDFEKDYGVHFIGKIEIPEASARRRGHNGSPIVDGDRVLVPVGNTNGASLVCFSKSDGKVLWKAGSDEAAYANLMTATLAGERQLVAYTADSLMGVRLEDGQVRWRIPLKTAAKRHVVTPIILGDRVIVSSHTLGLLCFEIRKDAASGAVEAKPAWSNRDLKISLATLVHVDGTLYGQGPDKNFVCVRASDGQLLWTQPGFGDRPLTGYTSTFAVGDRLLALTEQGQLILLRASVEGYRELSRLQVCGKNWSHPAFADGRLYLRDNKDLLAVDLGSAAQR